MASSDPEVWASGLAGWPGWRTGRIPCPASGNGWSNFTYDARGLVLSKDFAGTTSLGLRYRYDPAGRLIELDEVTGPSSTRPLKRQTYGRSNQGSNLRQGKLASATRYNWVDVLEPLGATGSLPVGNIRLINIRLI